MRWIARNGRACLIAGLVAGLALPGLAAAMQPWLPQMIALLLTLTALRIGWRAAAGAAGDLRWGIGSVLVLQLALPLVLLGALYLAGLTKTPAALALVLATSAPAISGSPNLALMMRQDAGRMMQILVVGTACFAVTVLPVLVLMPQLGPPGVVITAALRVLLTILVASAVGFALRALLFPRPDERTVQAMEGASTLAFAAIVIGLMAALTPALRTDPMLVFWWAVLAFAISYGLQLVTLLALRHSRLRSLAGPLAIGAGNRNIALFLVALPGEMTAPLMVFIGCWQLPMYLTPILLPRLYRWALRDE